MTPTKTQEKRQDGTGVRQGGSKGLSRRTLFRTLAALGAAGAGLPAVQALLHRWSTALAGEAADPGAPVRRWVMVIDLARCDGCGTCTEWCTEYHHVPFGQEWIKVYKSASLPKGAEELESEGPLAGIGDASSGGGVLNLPRPCMQCEDAPCVKVCPVGASFHDPDGIVLIDHDLCIGCRLCIAACPYEARYFLWHEPPENQHPEVKDAEYAPEEPIPFRRGTVVKCVFCAKRVREGELPVCVEACTFAGMKAIYFGDANEDVVTNGVEVLRLSQLLERNGGFRLKEELGTHPRVYYLPARKEVG